MHLKMPSVDRVGILSRVRWVVINQNAIGAIDLFIDVLILILAPLIAKLLVKEELSRASA